MPAQVPEDEPVGVRERLDLACPHTRGQPETVREQHGRPLPMRLVVDRGARTAAKAAHAASVSGQTGSCEPSGTEGRAQ